jgi:hypothetical protein
LLALELLDKEITAVAGTGGNLVLAAVAVQRCWANGITQSTGGAGGAGTAISITGSS